jgi:hypothetical protein
MNRGGTIVVGIGGICPGILDFPLRGKMKREREKAN